MSMGLEEALKVVDHMRDSYERCIAPAGMEAEYLRRRDALRVVLQCARENHVAKLVAEVNAVTAQALAVAEKPHAFRQTYISTPHGSRPTGRCGAIGCGRLSVHPLHDLRVRPTTP